MKLSEVKGSMPIWLYVIEMSNEFEDNMLN